MWRLLPVTIAALALAACGGTETENVSGSVDDTNTNQEEVDNEEAGTSEQNEDINYVVADNEKYSATLKNIVKKSDDIFGDSIEVVFEVENKTDTTIAFQSREVSADGYMVDDALISMSQEVAAGKKAKAVLSISDYEGYDFPELNEEFEMTLHVFNYDTFDTIEDHKFTVNLQ